MHHIGETRIVKYPVEQLVLTNDKDEIIVTLSALGVEKGPAFSSDESVRVFWDNITGLNPFQLQSEKEFLEQHIHSFLEGNMSLNTLRLAIKKI